MGNNDTDSVAPKSQADVATKDFDDLIFTDDFIFCKTLENNKELCKELAEMIIGKKISKIVKVDDQKAIRVTADGKGVRFDVCLEGEDEICDIEMQNDMDREELPKRSRYYQSAIDADKIAKGTPYKNLKKSYILFICKEKPFKDKELHKFTFRNICVQDPSLELGDETEKIFLTPKGKADDISKEVRDFMEYVADNKATSDLAKRLDDAVEAIKRGEGWRIEYMQLKEKLDRQYNAGHKAGIDEGMKKGVEQGIKQGIEQGVEKTVETYIIRCVEEGKSSEEIISELERFFGYSNPDAQRVFEKYAG